MYAVWLLIALITSFFTSSLLAVSPMGEDLPWMRALGDQILSTRHIPRSLGPEAFAAPGAPWVPHEWFTSLLLALLGTGPAFYLAPLAVGLATGGIFVLLALTAQRQGAIPRAIGVVMVLVAIAAMNVYGVRVQVLGWLCMAGFLALLRGPEQRRPWCIPLTVLWANLHAGVMLAPVFALIDAVGLVAERRRVDARTLKQIALVPAVALATLCTPLGCALPRYALGLIHSPFLRYIAEWARPSLAPAMLIKEGSWAFGALPVMALALIRIVRRRASVRETLLTGFSLYLAAQAVRNAPVCAIALAPLAMLELSDLLEVFAESRAGATAAKPPPWESALLTAGTVVAALYIGYAQIANRDNREANRIIPVRALADARLEAAPHRVFCEEFAACGAFLTIPGHAPFLDARADPYPAKVWDDFTIVRTLATGWDARLQTYRIDRVLTIAGSRLDREMARRAVLIDADTVFHYYRLGKS